MSENEEKATLQKTSRKRIALLEGACGAVGRVFVCGQVVDILFDSSKMNEEWDIFLNIPLSSKKNIRPIEDLYMTSVRGAILHIEVLDVCPSDFDSKEKYEVLHKSKILKTKKNGFFAYPIPATIPKGKYTIRITYIGVESVRQSLFDLKNIFDDTSHVTEKNQIISYGQLRLFDNEQEGLQIISDIDQTFIKTPIENKIALIGHIGENTTKKDIFLGMPELYKSLVEKNIEDNALFFLSASPHFFRRSMEDIFSLYDLKVDGLYLKYLNSIIDHLGKKMLELGNIFIANIPNISSASLFSFEKLNELLEENFHFLSTHLISIFNQVGYKLEMLLQHRLMQSTNRKEILIGDNTESDYFIFIIYQLLLQDEVTKKDLSQLKFNSQEVLTQEAIEKIASLTKKNIERHGKKNPIEFILINDLNNKNSFKKLNASLRIALKNIDLKKKESLCAKSYFCKEAFGMALCSYDASFITWEDVQEIAKASKKTKAQLKDILDNFDFQNKEKGKLR